MANVNLQRTSWGYGELDRRMLGRTDLPTYKQGVVKMENWLPAKSGAAVMRGGMEAVKGIATSFEADLIIPLRGGASPVVGVYNSTDQTFRALKADGTWVGTEEAPAEVTLFSTVTMTESDTDASEPYYWSPASSAERDALDAFYDTIFSYATVPNANCFKIKLSVGGVTQTLSMAGGAAVIDHKLTTTGVGAQLTLTPLRTVDHIIDPGIAGNVTRYIEKVVLKRPTVAPDDPIVAANLELYLDDDPTTTGGSGHDIAPWEVGGTITVLFNDDPGVLPMWAIEPNVAYDEIFVRLFRSNSDVRVYKVTDTDITEDLHNESGSDLVGPVEGGKRSSHGAYFEQRIVYGGGADHRQEIVGSRSPDPLTGSNRYGKWALSDTYVTSAADTTVQLFSLSSVHLSGTAPNFTDGRVIMQLTSTSDNKLLDAGFNSDGKFLQNVTVNYTENYGGSVGHLEVKHGTDETGPVSGSDLAVATETGLRVTAVRGDLEFEIPLGRADASQGRDTTDPYKYYTSASVAADDRLTGNELASIREFIVGVLQLDPVPEAASFTIKYELGATKSTSTTSVNADNAYRWVIDTGTTFAEVRWLQAYSGVLTVGTSAGVAICKFLNPDDPPEIRWHSSQCVSRRPPLVTPMGILAVSADRTSVYEVIRKRDLNAYSEDRFRKDRIHTIAWQQQPQQRLWVTTDAGKLHVLTIQDENGVNGWAQITHQHEGTCTGVVVTPGDDADDTVWFLMKYGAQSYVEKYHESTSNLHSNRVFMDSAVKRYVSEQTISMATSAADIGTYQGANSITLGPLAEIDNRISAAFVGSTAHRHIQSIVLKDADGSPASQFVMNLSGVGGAAADDLDLSSDFEASGKVLIRHTNPLTGTVTQVEVPMGGNDSSDPYTLTAAHLGSPHAANVTAFITAIRAIYPDGNNVPNSAHFEIVLSLSIGNSQKDIAIPDTMVGLTGKKLVISSALAAGDITKAAKYEIIDSPSQTSVKTNFDAGEEVWVGVQVVGDMELPAIEQSISARAVGSWLGQPARVPWVVAGVELSHSVKIGPTYDKLVEYFADTTDLSVTAAIPSLNETEPYVYTPSNSSEVDAWVTAVKVFHAVGSDVYGANLFTITLTVGANTKSVVCNGMDVGANSVTLGVPRIAANLLPAAFLVGGTGTRYVAGLIVANTSNRITLQIAPDTTTAAGTADARLIAGFESGGSVTVARTPNAALATGHERRPMPLHVSTTEPTVIRKDTPSPCTMTFLVSEATVG